KVPWVAAAATLIKIAHRSHTSAKEMASANTTQPTATLNVGDRLAIPGAQAPAVKASAPAAAAPAKPVAAAALKEAEPGQNANVAAPTDPLDKEAAKFAGGTRAVPEARWAGDGRALGHSR